MSGILDKIVSAVSAVGIDCEKEYCRGNGYGSRKGKISAYAGIKKISLGRLRNGVSDASVQVRVTVQAFGSDGGSVQEAAEKIVVPAVMACGEDFFGAEISEIFYDVTADRIYCEVIFDVRRCGHGI